MKFFINLSDDEIQWLKNKINSDHLSNFDIKRFLLKNYAEFQNKINFISEYINSLNKGDIFSFSDINNAFMKKYGKNFDAAERTQFGKFISSMDNVRIAFNKTHTNGYIKIK